MLHVPPMATRDRSRRRVYYFDGGCRPNPGPIEIAVVHRGIVHVRSDVGSGDNNEAEWLALRAAVELAAGAGDREVLFVGDSAVVIGQANGQVRCRSVHLQGHLAAYARAIQGFERVRLRLVRRTKNLAGIALDARQHAV